MVRTLSNVVVATVLLLALDASRGTRTASAGDVTATLDESTLPCPAGQERVKKRGHWVCRAVSKPRPCDDACKKLKKAATQSPKSASNAKKLKPTPAP